jgi:endonuclease/exonuclease/phosphatase family metal-dependent hydrolase
MKLKIMQYNILDGFYKEVSDEVYKLEKKRLNAAIEIVKREKPNVLILNEAGFSPSQEENAKKLGVKVNNYAKLFGYLYSFYGKRSKTGGCAVLSNFPIKGEDYSLKDCCFVRTKIFLKNKKINLDVFHPHPIRLSSEDKRTFLKNIFRDRKNPYIIVGDFNSVSPLDEYNEYKLIKGFTKLFNDFEKIKKSNKKGPKKIVRDILQAKAVSFVLETGLIDTYRTKHPKKGFVFTNPTNLFKKYQDAGMRLDYIFCSKDFKVLKSGIIKNKLTAMASDHYPIFAEVELK